MAHLTLAAITEDPDDKSGSIIWPSTVGSTLSFNGGELILKNRGALTIYTGMDGTVLQFGATFNGSSIVPATPATGSSPNQFDGPWALVTPGTVDFRDEAFKDIEIYGDIAYHPDINTEQYKVTLRSGEVMVQGADVIESAIAINHLHGSSAHRGHFLHATAAVKSTGYEELFFAIPNLTDAMEFVTDDGSGDFLNETGGIKGAYVIQYASGTSVFFPTAYTNPVITVIGTAFQSACLWPANNPARSMIAFCTLFPGSSDQPVVSGSGGSLAAATYTVRYCYYKALSLDYLAQTSTITGGATAGSTSITLSSAPGLVASEPIQLSGGIYPAELLMVDPSYSGGTTVPLTTAIKNGGHNKAGYGHFSQTIETPLSTATQVTIASGTANYMQFSIPPIPSGWDGFSIYADSRPASPEPALAQQTLGTSYTYTGTGPYLVTFSNLYSPALSITPSYGFSAWPTGTLLAKDPLARKYKLMKWAHVGATVDPKTNQYGVIPYNGAVSQGSNHTLQASAVSLPHLHTTTTYDAALRPVLGQDGSNSLAWVAGAGSGGMANPMTNQYDLIVGGTVTGGVAAPARLGVGTDGAVLIASTLGVVWSGPGFAGQVLTSRGGAAPAIFQAVSVAELTNSPASLILGSDNHITVSGTSAPGIGASGYTSVTIFTPTGDDAHVSFDLIGTYSAGSYIAVTFANPYINTQYVAAFSPTTSQTAASQFKLVNKTTAGFQLVPTVATVGTAYSYGFDIIVIGH